MRIVHSLLVLALVLGITTAACAAPSLLGPTGLLVVPTAETLAEDGFNLALFHVEDADDVAYMFNYGARPNLEVGFTRLPVNDTVVNAKYVFQQEAEGRVGIALGVVDLTDQINTTMYTVVSTRFTLGDLYGVDNFRATLGIAGGSDSQGAIPLNGLFGGVSFDVAQRVTLMLEHDGNSLNYGARGILGRGLMLHVGAVGDNHRFTIGASYNGQF